MYHFIMYSHKIITNLFDILLWKTKEVYSMKVSSFGPLWGFFE